MNFVAVNFFVLTAVLLLCVQLANVSCIKNPAPNELSKASSWDRFKETIQDGYSILQAKLTKKKTAIGDALANLQLPKMFEWDRYKEAFVKVYPSIREELARKKIFVASALKIYAHNVAFKMGLVKHFLKLNQLADSTPEEMGRMYMRANRSDSGAGSNKTKEAPNSSVLPEGLSLEQLREQLARIVVEKQPGYEIVVEQLKIKIDNQTQNGRNGKNGRKMRKKVSPAAGDTEPKSTPASRGPVTRKRKLAQDKRDKQRLIDELESLVDVPGEPKESAKYVKKVPPTNKNYRPIELLSQAPGGGYADNSGRLSEKELQWLESQQPRGSQGMVREQLLSALSLGQDVDSGPTDMEIDTPAAPTIMNRVYVDWRDSGCLTVPRHQGWCNSCYAFAYVALMEWWHCKQTGQLVPFSEQYMVDCGRHTGMSGCMGGNMPGIGKFIMDWGVELRSNYPYMGKDSVCPYEPHEWVHAGYKRPLISRFTTALNMGMWPLLLKHSGPIIVSLRIPQDFQFYGGQVHNGDNCALTPDGFVHAMLLVGHGIDDGQEYWLLRNSHGYQWGEAGYFKLSTRANAECFYEANEAEFDFINENMHPLETSLDGAQWRTVSPSEALWRGMADKDLSDVKVFY